MVKFLQNTPCKVLICLTGILSRQACVSSGRGCESGFSGQTGGLTCIIISCPQSYWICSFANWITVLVVALSAPNTSTFCTFHWLNKFCKFYNFCICNFFSFHKNCNLPLPLLFIYLQFFQFFAAAWKPGHMLRNTAPHSFSTQLYKWAPATYCWR